MCNYSQQRIPESSGIPRGERGNALTVDMVVAVVTERDIVDNGNAFVCFPMHKLLLASNSNAA